MDTKTIWKTVLSELELSLSRGTFLTFFSQTEMGSYNNGVVTISCPNPYSSSMIEERYYGLVRSTIAKHIKDDKFSLVFVVSPKITKKSEEILTGPLFSETTIKEKPYSNLRDDFTFETFAVSSSNQLAYAAATAVSRSLGKAYNPLFLWGGVGVGKTHLMHAVGNSLLQRNPSLRIVYCAGEEFTNEIIEAIRQKRTAAFKDKYRKANMLLIDDVQFIAGKQTVQEEFFHTFNAVYKTGGQIILTSDRPPSEISRLEDRLRSRFEGGMTADISPPDFELRTAILLIKAKKRGKDLPIEVAKMISANVTDNRKLEGTLTKLLTVAEMEKSPLTPQLATRVLGSASKQIKKTVSTKEVAEAVCSYFNCKMALIKSEKRDRPIAFPRQVLMYLLRVELRLSLSEIGEILGGRDHTTIIHGVDKITELLPMSDRLRDDIANIKQKVF